MHKELRPEQIDILVGSPAVNTEFSNKVRELDRRLQMNGMQYRDWDTLNDRQHDIFTDNLFLDGECASSAENYVKGAVEGCGCPATEEELHHHSPVLMREIEKQEDMLPDIKVKIGESLGNLNEFIDLMMEGLLSEAPSCAQTSPTEKSMRFEYVVIEAARRRGSGDSNLSPMVAPEPDQDKLNSKQYAKAKKEADKQTAAYICAATGWYQTPEGITSLGQASDDAIEAALSSGYISENDLAAATMGGVAKTSPVWGGRPIEPKTDVRFGEKNISLKLGGVVQAASTEADRTQQTLTKVMDEWLEQNALPSTADANAVSARNLVMEIFSSAKEQMLKAAKPYVASKRYNQIQNDIAALEAMDERTPKQDAKLQKYLGYRNVLQDKGIVELEKDGTFKAIAGEWNFDQWKETMGATLIQALNDLFRQTVSETTSESSTMSLQATLTDELLSGRRTFGEGSPAIAQYLLSPEHCYTLVPGEQGYDRTIDIFSQVIDVDVRLKGGRPLGPKKEGLDFDVGAKPAYRYDIDPKRLKAAIDQWEAKALAERKLHEQETEIDLEGIDDEAEEALESLQGELIKLVEDSLDVEQTAASMLE